MKKYTQKNKSQGTPLRVKILDIFTKKPFDVLNAKSIGRKIDFKGTKKFEEVNSELIKMWKDGLLDSLPRGEFKLKHKANAFFTGVVDFVNPRFCFVIVPELENDIKVSIKHMKSALDGDTVTVGLIGKEGKNQEGEINEVIKRARKEFVGTLQTGTSNWVIPANKKMHDDIYVREKELGDAKDGDKVLVRIIRWGSEDHKPEGAIEKVLGKEGEHEAEMHAIMYEFDLPMFFSKTIEKEANAIPLEISADEIAKRRDFRGVTTFTIDPFDAKDFDDAISLQTLANGNYEVGVHIADVSHYVRDFTELDNEAYNRGTSVYLVDRTIPMLPEHLSNGVCSLRANEEKCTFSAVFEIDTEGKVHNEWFGKTIIFSDRRFTYEEAQERIETKEGDFADEINILNALAYKLRAKRYKEGSISFETPEIKFKLDEDGTPLEIIQKIRKDAHKLVEDFMLLANKGVASFVYNKVKDGGPTMVYRTHDNPNPDKLNVFAVFAAKFGHKLNFQANVAKVLNKLTADLEGKIEEGILQQLAIRTMAKAVYTTEPKGHFGLGFEHYSHFTSPIRRYPDLMVHRLLFHYLNGGTSVLQAPIEDSCKHSSEREKVAADAERASIKYKQVEYIKNHHEKVFDGIISGVTEWGLYVVMTEAKCEGLLKYSELHDDRYVYDEDNIRAIGMNNKKIYAFGDAITVKVLRTDLRSRTIDLGLEIGNKTSAEIPKIQDKKPHNYNDLDFDN